MTFALRSLKVCFAFGIIALLSSCNANFHEIDPGKYYRSAQLTGDELDLAIKQYGIRTVINLRGAEPGAEWFETESKVTQQDHVTLVSIPMSAYRLPHRKDLVELVHQFETAERPMLVHCQGGADRTGEASAMYEMDYMGKSREEALEMLTLKYHHLELAAPAKRYFIGFYGGKDWVLNSYDPCQADYLYYDKTAFCGPQAQQALELISEEND